MILHRITKYILSSYQFIDFFILHYTKNHMSKLQAFKCCRANNSPSENIDKDRIRQNTDKIIVNGRNLVYKIK